MQKYDLKGLQASSRYQLNAMIDKFPLDGDWRNFTRISREICDHFLTLGAAALLADMKVDLFFHNIARCADNWHRYLVSSREYFGEQVTLTYGAPIFAAILANDTRLIHRIVRDLPRKFKKGEEYEEYFLFLKLMLNLAAMEDSHSSAMQADLDRFRKIASMTIRPDCFRPCLAYKA